jgi:hypothetical protein
VLLSDVLPDQNTFGWLDCATSYYIVQRRPATGWPPEGHRRRQEEMPRGLWVFHTASCGRSHPLQSRPPGNAPTAAGTGPPRRKVVTAQLALPRLARPGLPTTAPGCGMGTHSVTVPAFSRPATTSPDGP